MKMNKRIRKDFLERKILSICYLMRKYGLDNKKAREIIKELSTIAKLIIYDEEGPIRIINSLKLIYEHGY